MDEDLLFRLEYIAKQRNPQMRIERTLASDTDKYRVTNDNGIIDFYWNEEELGQLNALTRQNIDEFKNKKGTTRY